MTSPTSQAISSYDDVISFSLFFKFVFDMIFGSSSPAQDQKGKDAKGSSGHQ